MSEVGTREQELRDFIVEPVRNDEYRVDLANYFQLIASLDAVGDTDTALDAFLEKQERENYGEWYLATYGVMQALVIQQDAVSRIAITLNLPYTPDAKLTEIRRLRNDAVGHPTARGAEPGSSFTAIARISLSQDGFYMLRTRRSPFENQTEQIDLPDLIRSQQSLLAASLSQILIQLRERG
ncbi:MAG: hypothetical protein JNK38_26360 [Acidobacteria bacterium]|nr:hypothetical protein [Acidobacteriota bacterium]